MEENEEKTNIFAKIGGFFRNLFDDSDGESYYRSDKFWVYRWYQDWKYKRVGLITIKWMGEEYGYRMDVERIPKKQLDDLRRSIPSPVHRSNAGWNEWILIDDTDVSPFPEVRSPGSEYYEPTAIDLYMYMTNKDLDDALTFKKKKEIPIDGKMLLLCIAGVAVLAFIVLRMFA